MITPTDYLRLAVDPLRLAVLGRAALGPVDADRLAGTLGVDRREVLEAVGRLRGAGLLDDGLQLDRGALRAVAEALPRIDPPGEVVTEGEWTAEEAGILARFFSGSRLTRIPSQRSKRLVVLERLVQEFEPGLRYSERQVDLALQVFHPDYASLRRHLVDEAMMTRADGTYWRTGGRTVVS